MSAPRHEHRAALLQDGTVLVTGGYNFNGPGNTLQYLATAELYHPDTRTFELLPATMTASRYDHTSTALANGTVLIAGGSGPANGGNFGTWQSAELYIVASRTFTRRQHAKCQSLAYRNAAFERARAARAAATAEIAASSSIRRHRPSPSQPGCRWSASGRATPRR